MILKIDNKGISKDEIFKTEFDFIVDANEYMTNVNIRLTGVQLMPLYRYRSWRISGTVIRLQHP